MLLQHLCLKPTYSLRWQLLLSFGSSTALAIAATLLFSMILTRRAGMLVQDKAGAVMSEQVRANLARSTRFTGETFTKYMSNIEGVAQIMAELVMDRIVGYPSDSWEEDTNVPFFDILSQRNVYPLATDPLPLDWNITVNLTPENAWENLQEREAWADIMGTFSTTSTGSFFMRGSCTPGADETDFGYVEGCSLEHNNVATGGVFAPSPTTHGLYRKSGDLTAFWRPLYESHPDLLLMGMYFFNSGAGAIAYYPGHVFMQSWLPYISAGCEWMRDINPYTSEPYGTEDDIQRCHPRGTKVIARDYNPNEREWYQQMVAARGKIMWYGPFNSFGAPISMMSVGKAIYDRKTNELIGVVTVDLSTTQMNAGLKDLVRDNHTIIAVVNYENGELVANSEDPGLLASKYHNLSDLGLDWYDGIFEHIKESLEDSLRKGWTAEHQSQLLFNCSYGVLSAYPIPSPPLQYDPEYRPLYVAIQAAADTIFDPIDDFGVSIDNEIRDAAFVTAAIGAVGLGITLLFVWFVSIMFTEPLLWIGSVSKKILNHADRSSGDIIDTEFKTTVWTPNTEIMELVESFKKMIESFSGDHPPSVAVADFVEVRNTITWQSDFCQLYEKGLEAIILARKGTSASTPVTEEESRAISDGKEDQVPASVIARDLPNTKESTVSRSQIDLGRALKSEDMGLREEFREERPLSFVVGVKASEPGSNEGKKSLSVVPAPPKQNLGRNIPVSNDEKKRVETDGWFWVCRSKLFRWILLRLVTPLILAMVAICVVVTVRIMDTVPGWVDTLSDETLSISRDALASFVILKSRLVEEMLTEPFRDLYTMSRVANWIHASAIPLKDSFTQMDHATEDCKTYDYYECPLFYEQGRFPCTCSWGDPLDIPGRVCSVETSRMNSRLMQRRFHACQSKGTDPTTGDRRTGSGVVVDETPDSTEWWSNATEFPGFLTYASDPFQATTYRRAKTSSSFAVIEFPLYNYATELDRLKHHLGTYTAYEADGFFAGFQGCQYSYPNYAQWKSSPENHAAEVRPGLCPIGEHGYDPRCRPWYQETLEDFQDHGAFVHLTPPYSFADEKDIGFSVVSPILDPTQGPDPIGQVLLDFLPNGMWEAFETIDRPLSFMVATKADLFRGDTVIGPDRSRGWSSARISDLLFKYDSENSTLRLTFEEEFLNPMKEGEGGTGSFCRTTEDGREEKFTMSFYPVFQRFLRPVDSTDLTRGAIVERKQIYSIGIAAYDDELKSAFRHVDDEVSRDLRRLAIIDVVLSVAIAALFTAFAFRVSVHVTKPILTLLKIVQGINRGEVDEDIHPLRGASREFSQVYMSFSKLNKVVGISNKAFFSGNLDWAYHFIYDALQLFRQIDDQKAIGVACNNLGNTIFGMAIQGQSPWMLANGSNITIQTALDYYDEAIEICKRDFDCAQDNYIKVEYAQHLADRYFNRGLYLLFVAQEADAPPDSRAAALKDIERARDLDYDVRDFFLDKKILFQHSDSYFWRLIRRIFGLSTHCLDAEVMQVWNVRNLVEDADSLLSAAWTEPNAPVFKDLGRINRLQQLEAAALRLELCEGNSFEAARMAMRMLAEDEYILACAFPVAASAILESMRLKDGVTWSPSTCLSVRNDLRAMSGLCRNIVLDLGKCVIFTLELNECFEGGPLLSKVKSHCLRIFDAYCKGEDHVGVAAYTVRGDQTLRLSKKELHGQYQRKMLDVATTSTSEMVSPSLPYAMQMIVDSSATTEKDTYILLMTDGYSWDVEGYRDIKHQIEKFNRERMTSIHLLILGLDIEDDEIVNECRALSAITKSSMFLEISLDNVDAAFASVISTINALQLTEPSIVGITMEKF